MKNSIYLPLTTAAMLALGPSAGAFEDAPFPHYKEVNALLAEEGIAAVSLDSDVFEEANADFANIRVVNISGGNPVEVPWDLERVEKKPRPQRENLSFQKTSFQEGEDNRIQVTVKLDPRKQNPNRLSILTPLSDFERRVQVSGSMDGENWTDLVEADLIFDYSRFLDFRRTTIDLPPGNYDYLRVVLDGAVENLVTPYRQISRSIEGGTESEKEIHSKLATRPFRIDQLKLFFDPEPEETIEQAPENYRVSGIEVSEDKENKQTVVTIRSLRQPLTQFTLLTGNKNFRRSVHLQIPADPENLEETIWKTVGGGSVLRYDIGSVQEERLTVKTTEQRQSVYRLVIENKDNAPLAIDGVSTSGPAYDLQFLSDRNQKFRVYYGGLDKKANRPSYDVSALRVAKTKGMKAETFPTSPEQTNSNYDDSIEEPATSLLESKIFLWGAIALVVLILILVLFRTAKRIEELPQD